MKIIVLLKKIPGILSAACFTVAAAIYWVMNCTSMRKLQFDKLDVSEIDREILTTVGYPTWKDYLVTYFLMLFLLIGVISVFFSIFRERGRGSTLTLVNQLFSLALFAVLGKQILDGESKFLYDKELFICCIGLILGSLLFSTLYALIVFRTGKRGKQKERELLRQAREQTKIAILDRCTLTVGDIDFSPLDALGETEYFDVLSHDEIKEKCADADMIICNKAVIDGDIMDACKKLKYIGLFATGYNNIDLKAAREHKITVCNAPDYSTDSVAQLVFAYILEKATSLSKYNESTHNGEWIKSRAFSYFPYPIQELKGKYIGIIGYGSIGKRVAKIADAFGMRVFVTSRREIKDCPYNTASLDTLFEISDFLTIHCPLTDKTRGMVNAERLSKMKRTAYLINTSRGGVIVENDLRNALDTGVISGAAIDVLTLEPMTADNPLLQAQNLTITPHIAWASYEARERLIKLVASNIASYQSGFPRNTVL